MNEDSNNKRLIGIKAIADYLEMSPRNVYRWEKELGLPLHRVSGTHGHRVYADVSELEEWLARRADAEVGGGAGGKRMWIVYGAISALAVVVTVASLVIYALFVPAGDGRVRSNPAGPPIPDGPAALTAKDGLVEVLNRTGEILWVYRIYKDSSRDSFTPRFSSMRDIDGDGAKELAAAIYEPENNRFYLCLFDHDGRVIWRRGIDEGRTFGGVRINNDYFCEDTLFWRNPAGEDVIFTKWRNKARFLSIIACIDLHGQVLYKYLHTGHLGRVLLFDLDRDGVEELYFCGTNNLLCGEPVIGALPANGFHGISPPFKVEPEYTAEDYRLKMYIADDPQPGNELAYIRFRPTEHFKDLRLPWAFAEYEDIDTSGFNVRVGIVKVRLSADLIQPFFGFDANLGLEYAIPSPGMLRHFSELQKMAGTDITLKHYLELLADNVLRWRDGEWVPVERARVN